MKEATSKLSQSPFFNVSVKSTHSPPVASPIAAVSNQPLEGSGIEKAEEAAFEDHSALKQVEQENHEVKEPALVDNSNLNAVVPDLSKLEESKADANEESKEQNIQKQDSNAAEALLANEVSPNNYDVKKPEMKFLRKLFNFINKFSKQTEANISNYDQVNAAKPRTRKNTKPDELPESVDPKNRTVMTGYAHYTCEALASIMSQLADPKELFAKAQLAFDSSFELSSHSIFLDIGSGLGFPTFFAAGMMRCKSIGIEACKARAEQSNLVLSKLDDDTNFKHLQLAKMVEFIMDDACKAEDQPFVDSVGQHVTHVYAYNLLSMRHDSYMSAIIKRLNLTAFKLLIWSAAP